MLHHLILLADFSDRKVPNRTEKWNILDRQKPAIEKGPNVRIFFFLIPSLIFFLWH